MREHNETFKKGGTFWYEVWPYNKKKGRKNWLILERFLSPESTVGHPHYWSEPEKLMELERDELELNAGRFARFDRHLKSGKKKRVRVAIDDRFVGLGKLVEYVDEMLKGRWNFKYYRPIHEPDPRYPSYTRIKDEVFVFHFELASDALMFKLGNMDSISS